MSQNCGPQSPAQLVGAVRDPSGAVVVGARVTLDGPGGATAQTGSDGRYGFPCLPVGKHKVEIAADGFDPTQRTISVGEGRSALDVSLRVMEVKTSVTVGGGDQAVDSSHSAGTIVLSGEQLGNLSDDPDELLRQLQAMSASAGGPPSQAIVTIDGFMGASRLPSKSSIASVRINPDLFAAEYDKPPYTGGRIEIITKAGQDRYHGELFVTGGSSVLDAKTPLALVKAPSDRLLAGAEVSGPLLRKRVDGTFSVEQRHIDQNAVVNAVTPDGHGGGSVFNLNVATPQQLWLGSARLDATLGKLNYALTYNATRNRLDNQGIGGLLLPEAGFNTTQDEDDLRLTQSRVISSKMFDEVHVSAASVRSRDLPFSLNPQVQVAGSFTGGGASVGPLRSTQTDVEADYDISLASGAHNWKLGEQTFGTLLREDDTEGANGSYLFAGTNNLSALGQYSVVATGAAGIAPTDYTVVSGNTSLRLSQWRTVAFAEDEWKLTRQVSLSPGIRYEALTNPASYSTVNPRLGAAWSPGRQKWVLRGHVGMFVTPAPLSVLVHARQLDGVHAFEHLLYDPAYGPGANGSGQSVTTVRSVGLNGRTPEAPSFQAHLGVEGELPQRWHLLGNVYFANGWKALRSESINAPLPGDGDAVSPTATRPLLPNTNIFNYQWTGNTHATIVFAGVNQYSLKHLQLFAGYIYMHIRSDADDPEMFSQSVYTNSGEMAQPSWAATHRIMSTGAYKLPWQLSLSEVLECTSGLPYNVLTGADRNGDGVFNDRPVLALAGQAGAQNTPFGLLAAAGAGPSLSRDAARLPWSVGLDLSMARTFHLKRFPDQGLTFTSRSLNVLNKRNVTSAGNVLGSPLFLAPVAAENGRRFEMGARLSF